MIEMGFTKGQRVHVLRSANERRRDVEPFVEGTVTKIGRRYAYVTFPGSYGEVKFDLDGGYEATDYPGSSRRIMDDKGRARYDRDRRNAERFRSLLLAGMYHDLRRFSIETVEAVLDLLEADLARKTSVTR
jgi:hypothetical protein